MGSLGELELCKKTGTGVQGARPGSPAATKQVQDLGVQGVPGDQRVLGKASWGTGRVQGRAFWVTEGCMAG